MGMRIDCHNDTVGMLREHAGLASLPQAHLDWQRFREHLDVAFFAIFIDQHKYANESGLEFRRLFRALLADIDRQQGIEPLLWRDQLEGEPAAKLALIAMEGADPLGWRAANLDDYFHNGLRAIGLTWNYATEFAGSCMQGGGLTKSGRDLVRRCNELGVLLDAAHASSRTLNDLLRWSSRPIIDSHTVCAAICDRYPRACSDADLRALANRGGVAAITMVPDFLGGAGDMQRLCEHIEYAVKLIGSEHVGLGGDYDGAEQHPDYAGIEKRQLLLDELQRRGMAAADLENVAGESVRRVLRQVLPNRP